MSICFHRGRGGGGKIPNGRIATSYAKCIFNFLRNCLPVLKWMYHFAFQPAVYEIFYLSFLLMS